MLLLFLNILQHLWSGLHTLAWLIVEISPTPQRSKTSWKSGASKQSWCLNMPMPCCEWNLMLYRHGMWLCCNIQVPFFKACKAHISLREEKIVAQVHTLILQFEQAHESRKEKEKERNNGQWTQKPYTKEARKRAPRSWRPHRFYFF
jgi:hypothetical protein